MDSRRTVKPTAGLHTGCLLEHGGHLGRIESRNGEAHDRCESDGSGISGGGDHPHPGKLRQLGGAVAGQPATGGGNR